jgi:hypothetical protein
MSSCTFSLPWQALQYKKGLYAFSLQLHSTPWILQNDNQVTKESKQTNHASQ